MKKATKLTILLLSLGALSFFGASCGDDHSGHDHDHGEHHEDGDDKTSSTGGDDGYPLTTCVVSGEDLGSMGTPVVVTHEGTKVKLCCDSCIEDFEKDPAKYAAMVKAKPAGE